MKRGTRKKKFNMKNVILWTITYMMFVVMLVTFIMYAFGQPSWVQAVLYMVGTAWCWIFASVNSKGE